MILRILRIALIVLFGYLMLHSLFLHVKEPFETNTNTTDTNTDTNTNKEQNKEENKDKENTYQPYNVSDPSNALILAQQNAGNIEVLKGRIDNLGVDNITQQINTMQQSMNLMQTQIDGLVQQQADYAQEIAGTSTPLDVTGTN